MLGGAENWGRGRNRELRDTTKGQRKKGQKGGQKSRGASGDRELAILPTSGIQKSGVWPTKSHEIVLKITRFLKQYIWVLFIYLLTFEPFGGHIFKLLSAAMKARKLLFF